VAGLLIKTFCIPSVLLKNHCKKGFKILFFIVFDRIKAHSSEEFKIAFFIVQKFKIEVMVEKIPE
jgi:hypothetical protein